jgi:hypothetical protein
MVPDRAASFLGFPISSPKVHEGPGLVNWVCSLYGMTEGSMKDLVYLARSWARAPELVISGKDFRNSGFDISQRSYILENLSPGNPVKLESEIRAGEQSPMVNACFVVKDWGQGGSEIYLDGGQAEMGKNIRQGHIRRLTGTDLVLWIGMISKNPVKITLIPKEQ